MLRSIILASTILFAGAAHADGHGHSHATLEIGAAPALSAVTVTGETVGFDEISGANGAVIVFSRSLEWCPYCKAQAIELETIKADLEASGWSLNILTYDAPDTMAKFAKESGLTYTTLSDTDSATIDAFGLRNTEMTPGSRFDGIPHPAIVYMAADGTVAGVQKEDGYETRPETAGIPAMAASLTQAAAR